MLHTYSFRLSRPLLTFKLDRAAEEFATAGIGGDTRGEPADQSSNIMHRISVLIVLVRVARKARVFVTAACFGLFLSTGVVNAQSDEVTAIDFDISVQSLASALEAYSTVTGIVAVYDGRLGEGRFSGAVRGRYTPSAALKLLLATTGLSAQYTSKDAFVLVPASTTQAVVVRTPSVIGRTALATLRTAEQQYSGLVQFAVTKSLCSRNDTHPGDYRLAMSFWIGPAGEITRVKLLGSTGDRQRDVAVLDALHGVRSVGASPPAAMAQPFTMIMLPLSSGGVVDCPTSGQRNG